MRPTLVTGASGFAGSHLLDRLSERATLLGWHRPGRPAHHNWPGVRWTAVDLLDRASVIRAVREIAPARIYHLAGAPRTDTSWVTVVPHLETNVLGTRNLFDAVHALNAPCR